MNDHTFVGYLMLVVGSPFLAIGAGLIYRSVHFSRRGTRVVGSVVRYHCEPGDDGQYPVVEYTDACGTDHQRKLDISLGPPAGEAIPLAYDPANPEWAIGTEWGQMWGLPGVITAVGICITGFGTAIVAGWI
jgi:hypothetical protein